MQTNEPAMIMQARSPVYYYVGAFLVALAIVLMTLLSTMEILYGGAEQLYTICMAVVIVGAFTGSILLTGRALRKGQVVQVHFYITGILRFVTSSVMLGYAFTKLSNGHMYASYAALDTKLSDLSDFDTVWSFYGRYSSMQALLGIMELVPALLLLFRRTAFIGAVLILPLAANVLLLNIYFRIGLFTLPVIALVMIFSIYILYAYKEQVRDFLQQVGRSSSGDISAGRFRRILRVLKFLPLALLLFIFTLKLVRHHEPRLPKGAYELVEFSYGGQKIAGSSLPLHAYRKIYFEKRRIQNSLVNGAGHQGAGIHFHGKDTIAISYRNGALDMQVAEDTVGSFTGQYTLPNDTSLILKGMQNGLSVEAHYRKVPLREFAYWWE